MREATSGRWKVAAFCVTMAGAALVLSGAASPCKLLSSCGTGGGEDEAAAGRSDAPDTVVAKVNGKAITRADVDKEFQAAVGPGGTMPDDTLAAMRTQLEPRIREALVVQTLLHQAVEQAEVTITEAELQDALEDITGLLPPGTTLDEVKAQLGVSDEEWQMQVKQDLCIRKLFEARAEDVGEPNDAEIEAFYAKYETALRDEAGMGSMDEARDAIVGELRAQKYQEAFQRFIEDLRSKAQIEYPDAGA